MTLIIREARTEDASQLIAYMVALSEEPEIDLPLGRGEFDLTIDEERQVIEDYHAAENCLFLVAEDAGQIVGCLTCQGGRRRALRHAALLGMSVAQTWRGQGIGRAMLTHAIEWARGTHRVTRIELTVYARNKRAIHLYHSAGFITEGRLRRAVFQDGAYIDIYVMGLLF